jgi:hypothetical protein
MLAAAAFATARFATITNFVPRKGSDLALAFEIRISVASASLRFPYLRLGIHNETSLAFD